MDTEALSRQQTEELREAFAIFDKDGDGSITSEELLTVMSSMRQDATEDEIRDMIQQVDIDGKGHVNYEEFLELMFTMRQQRSVHAEMRDAFSVFDIDGDGYITADDVSRTMADLGEQLSKEDILHMVHEADADGDGRINFNEFINMLKFGMGGAFAVEDPLDERFTPEEYSDLKLAFSLFDKNHDGFISLDEMTGVVFATGKPTSRQSLERLFNEADLDGNGLIDFREFVEMMELRLERQSADSEMRGLFTAFDRDRNGYIDKNELKATFIELGMGVTDTDIGQMMAEVGVETSGRIYYEDFLKLMSGKIGQAHRQVLECNIPESELNELLTSTDQAHADTDKQEWKEVFANFDKNNDGSIDKAEVRAVITALGRSVDDKCLEHVFTKADLDGNGKIDFDEFLKLLDVRSVDQTGEVELTEMFAVFDQDGSGFICRDELQSTMCKLGLSLSERDLSDMLREANVPDGRIYFKDFVKIVTGKIGTAQEKETPKTETTVEPVVVETVKTEPSIQSVALETAKEGPFILPVVTQTLQSGPPKPPHAPQKMTAGGRVGENKWEKTQEKHRKTDCWNAFKMFDTNSDGYISIKELRATMEELGVTLMDRDVDKMMQEADTNQDGKIDYKEFKQLYQGGMELFISEAMKNRASIYEKTVERRFNEDDLRKAFDAFDKNRRGKIATCDVAQAMQSLGMHYSAKELDRMTRRYSLKGNGTIDFVEFLTMMERSRTKHEKSEEAKRASEEAEMRQAFRVFDLDNNGLIDAHELKLTMNNLGEELSDEDVTAMIAAADKNGDGKIDYEEFIKMMYNK